MRLCRAIQYGKCVGNGEITSGNKFYCTEKCRKRSRTSLRKEMDKKILKSKSGCTLRSSSAGRCLNWYLCKHYSDCLILSLKLGGDGFISDGKGFELKNDNMF